MEFDHPLAENRFLAAAHSNNVRWDTVTLATISALLAQSTLNATSAVEFQPFIPLLLLLFTSNLSLLATCWQLPLWYIQHRTYLLLIHRAVMTLGLIIIKAAAPLLEAVTRRQDPPTPHTILSAARLMLSVSHMGYSIAPFLLHLPSTALVWSSAGVALSIVFTLPFSAHLLSCDKKNLDMFAAVHAAAPQAMKNVASMFYGEGTPQATVSLVMAVMHLCCVWWGATTAALWVERRARLKWTASGDGRSYGETVIINGHAWRRPVHINHLHLVCSLVLVIAVVSDATIVSTTSQWLLEAARKMLYDVNKPLADYCGIVP